MADTQHPVASGIEELIGRLRREGVEEGEAEASRMLADAETKARDILQKAEAKATAMRDAARDEADRTRKSGEEALRAAMRDAVLELKDDLARRFAEQVGGTVSDMTRDDEMLKAMILSVAARARTDSGAEAAKEMEVILPRSAVGLDQLRKNPEELKEGTLSHFVASEAREMLREGITLSRAEDDAAGLRLVLKDNGMEVDLTDRAVASVILRHLQPRFRALLEGVVS